MFAKTLGAGSGIPLATLFEAPTVADLAVTVAQSLAELEDGEQMAQLVAELEQLSEVEVRAMLADEMGTHVGDLI